MKTSYTIRVLRRRATELLLASLLASQGQALAHEGHEYDEPEPAAATAPAPSAAAPRLEAVARREGGDIVLYLDDYATNAPLDGLQVSVHSGSLTAQAAGGEGRYRFPADLLQGQAAQLLELSVHGADLDAQLAVELSAAAPAAADSLWSSRLAAAALILALLVAAGLLRRRRGAGAGQEARIA